MREQAVGVWVEGRRCWDLALLGSGDGANSLRKLEISSQVSESEAPALAYWCCDWFPNTLSREVHWVRGSEATAGWVVLVEDFWTRFMDKMGLQGLEQKVEFSVRRTIYAKTWSKSALTSVENDPRSTSCDVGVPFHSSGAFTPGSKSLDAVTTLPNLLFFWTSVHCPSFPPFGFDQWEVLAGGQRWEISYVSHLSLLLHHHCGSRKGYDFHQWPPSQSSSPHRAPVNTWLWLVES